MSKQDMKCFLVKPDLIQPDGVVNPDSFHFGCSIDSYHIFIEEYKKKKAKMDERDYCYEGKKIPFLYMYDLSKYEGWRCCSGCGNYVVNCHDVVFGPFCLYEVMSFCTERGKFYG